MLASSACPRDAQEVPIVRASRPASLPRLGKLNAIHGMVLWLVLHALISIVSMSRCAELPQVHWECQACSCCQCMRRQWCTMRQQPDRQASEAVVGKISEAVLSVSDIHEDYVLGPIIASL